MYEENKDGGLIIGFSLPVSVASMTQRTLCNSLPVSPAASLTKSKADKNREGGLDRQKQQWANGGEIRGPDKNNDKGARNTTLEDDVLRRQAMGARKFLGDVSVGKTSLSALGEC